MHRKEFFLKSGKSDTFFGFYDTPQVHTIFLITTLHTKNSADLPTKVFRESERKKIIR